MEIIAYVFAGLGLFFIGAKEIGSSLKQLAGRRFHQWVARATGNRFTASLIGITSGMLTQSTNAVTFIIISLTNSGMVEIGRTLPILAWANVGTSVIVFLVTVNIHLAVLYLLGLVGLCHFFSINENDRYRSVVGTFFGIGLLFLGLWLIKTATVPLKDMEWLAIFKGAPGHSLLLGFVLSAVITLVIQSSSITAAFSLTMTVAGILQVDQAVMIVLGANLGSGLGTYLLARNLHGPGRQLALIQFWIKSVGVVLVLPFVVAELWWQVPGLMALASRLTSNLGLQVASLFSLLQVISAVTATLFESYFLKLACRRCPPSLSQELSRPQYLYAQAVDEAESALDLVEKEQARLIRLLPHSFDQLRRDELEGKPYETRALYAGCANVARECTAFLYRLISHAQSRVALERALSVRSRNELLINLQDESQKLAQLLRAEFVEPEGAAIQKAFVESVCTILMEFADAMSDGTHQYEWILALTADKNAVLDGLKERLIHPESGVGVENQGRLLTAVSIFERVNWLANRYVRLAQQDAGHLNIESPALSL